MKYEFTEKELTVANLVKDNLSSRLIEKLWAESLQKSFYLKLYESVETMFDYVFLTANNVCALKEYGYLKEKEDAFYSIGDRFVCDKGNEHILSQINWNSIALISLENGNRWEDPVEVQNILKITRSEFAKITVNGDFKKID